MISRVNSVLFLSLWAILAIPVFGQGYYPLKIGNAWYYHSIALPPNDSTVSSFVRVVGDSLFSNGHTYFALSDNDIMGGRFLRTDSTSIFYINPYSGQEQRVFKLDGLIGDTVQISWGPFSIVRLAAIDTITLLGIRQRVLRFELDGILYAVLRLSEKFGPITEWRYGDPPPPWPDWGRDLIGCMIDTTTYGITLNVSQPPPLPQSFELFQNYPNPFNPETNISYNVRTSGSVLLRIFDCLGREMRTLVDDVEHPGHKSVRWDGRDNQGHLASSGTYFYELTVNDFRFARRMLFIK
jgi:hypothetical protein